MQKMWKNHLCSFLLKLVLVLPLMIEHDWWNIGH